MINLHERMLPTSTGVEPALNLLVSSRTAHPTEPPRPANVRRAYITKTRLFKYIENFTTKKTTKKQKKKTESFQIKIMIFFIFLLKTYIVGTRYNRLAEAVQTSTPYQCFEQKYENYQNFSSKSFHCLVVNISIYLNRRVFVMKAVQCLPVLH